MRNQFSNPEARGAVVNVTTGALLAALRREDALREELLSRMPQAHPVRGLWQNKMMLNCKRCGAAAIHLPGDLATLKVVCNACRSEQFVREYVSDADRLRGVAAQIMQGQADLRRGREHGVACKNCGGTTALPASAGAHSFSCQFCHAQLLVADYVDARVIAGENLRAGLDAMRREAEKRRRTATIVTMAILAVVMVVVVVVVVVLLITHHP